MKPLLVPILLISGALFAQLPSKDALKDAAKAEKAGFKPCQVCKP